MPLEITIDGIEQAISNLNYQNQTALKFKLLQVIRQHYTEENDILSLSEIDTDSLIQSLWDTGNDPNAIQNRKKNLNSIKSKINMDLKKLFDGGQNPQGISIGKSNIFVISDEARDKYLESIKAIGMGDGLAELNKIANHLSTIDDFLSAVSASQEGEEKGIEDRIDQIKTLIQRIAEKVDMAIPKKYVNGSAESNSEIDDTGYGGTDKSNVGIVEGKGETEEEKGKIEFEETTLVDDGSGTVGDEDIPGTALSGDHELETIDENEFEEIEIADDALAAVEENEAIDTESVEDDEIETIDEDEFEEIEITDEGLDGIEEGETPDALSAGTDELATSDGDGLEATAPGDDGSGADGDEDGAGAALTGDLETIDEDEFEEIEVADEGLDATEEDEIPDAESIDDDKIETIDEDEFEEIEVADEGLDATEEDENPDAASAGTDELATSDGDGLEATVPGDDGFGADGDEDGADTALTGDQVIEMIDEDEFEEMEVADDVLDEVEEGEAPEMTSVEDEEIEMIDADDLAEYGYVEDEIEIVDEDELEEMVKEALAGDAVDTNDAVEDIESLPNETDAEDSDSDENTESILTHKGNAVGAGFDPDLPDEIDPDSMTHAIADIPKAKMLSESFNESLAAMDKFYNHFVLIPEGTYRVSHYPDTNRKAEHYCERPIRLSSFYIGVFPITNALFEVFVEKTGYVTTAEKCGYGTVYQPRTKRIIDPDRGTEQLIWNAVKAHQTVPGACWYQPAGPGSTINKKRNHPVTQISLADAMAFAAWTGKRLPTENEWEAASRTERGFRFPWGNEWQNNACNIEESQIGDTTTVDRYIDFKNNLGIIDTLGNVLEWTSEQIETPSQKTFYIAKGGSWISEPEIESANRCQFTPDTHSNILGFRCVAY